VFIDRREGALRLFADKERLRKQARANGMCTRCIVRPAFRGKAYCQRCTDYAKQYAKRGKQGSSGIDRYRDKAMRVADYGCSKRTVSASEPYTPEITTPEPRRCEHFADLTRARANGAAIPLRNPIPIPVGLNSWYDEIGDD